MLTRTGQHLGGAAGTPQAWLPPCPFDLAATAPLQDELRTGVIVGVIVTFFVTLAASAALFYFIHQRCVHRRFLPAHGAAARALHAAAQLHAMYHQRGIGAWGMRLWAPTASPVPSPVLVLLGRVPSSTSGGRPLRMSPRAWLQGLEEAGRRGLPGEAKRRLSCFAGQ